MRSLTKRQKDIALLVLAVLFFLVLAGYSWFQLYAPAKEDNERVIRSLADQREIQFELQRQLAAKTDEISSSSRPLQQKVPVLPLEELILVQLEKAEVKSDALIRDVLFTESDLVIEGLDAKEEIELDEDLETAPPADPAEGLSQLTIDVDLTASSYREIDRFIREMESMDRIYIVQSIQLDPPEETNEADAEEEPLELTIAFDAFYRPDLTDLIPEVPKLDAPVPSGKKDPTPRAGESGSE